MAGDRTVREIRDLLTEIAVELQHINQALGLLIEGHAMQRVENRLAVLIEHLQAVVELLEARGAGE